MPLVPPELLPPVLRPLPRSVLVMPLVPPELLLLELFPLKLLLLELFPPELLLFEDFEPASAGVAVTADSTMEALIRAMASEAVVNVLTIVFISPSPLFLRRQIPSC